MSSSYYAILKQGATLSTYSHSLGSLSHILNNDLGSNLTKYRIVFLGKKDLDSFSECFQGQIFRSRFQAYMTASSLIVESTSLDMVRTLVKHMGLALQYSLIPTHPLVAAMMIQPCNQYARSLLKLASSPVHSISGKPNRSEYKHYLMLNRGAMDSQGSTSWTGKPELTDYVSVYLFMVHLMDSPDVMKNIISGRERPLLVLGGYSYVSFSIR